MKLLILLQIKSILEKKVIKFNKKLPPLKGTKKKRLVEKESNWINYYGSNDVIKNLIKEKNILNLKEKYLYLPIPKLN